ncbi:MAG TPA: hypothetical protein VJP60_01040 [Rhizomicrobium sp.]|nr:hypothetical protein [Rhizomicrobium sp.]
MRVLAVGLALLLAITGPVIAADKSPDIDPTIKVYDSTWDPYPVGEFQMRLGEHSANFSELKGSLILQYAGTMQPATEGFRESRIYRILNSQEFRKRNNANKKYLRYLLCDPLPKWLGIATTTNPASDIRLELFSIDDYRAYDPNKGGLCASLPYRPKRAVPHHDP